MGSLMRLISRSCSHQLIRSNNQGMICPVANQLNLRQFSDKPTHPTEQTEPWIPEYIEKFEEPLDEKRSRLIYQSRKRGMLENGLLLGSFAKKYIGEMDAEKLSLYDRLINLPSNDWEIYYWATDNKPTPEEFDNVIMDMLKAHSKNEERQFRGTLPDL